MRPRISVACTLLVLCLSTGQAQSPDSPAARQLRAWLDAFNNGDAASLEQFPLAIEVGRLTANQALRFRFTTGGFELRKTEESTATRLVGLLQERASDHFARFTIEVDAGEPHRVSRLELRAIPRPPEFAISPLGEAALIAALRSRMDAEVAADRFAGVVMLARNGKPLFAEAYGLADREKKIASTLETRFRIGSMNKMFTATAILQLAQAGKLRLDDPLGRYLTGYPNTSLASKVTIHHLLTHTGGTGDFFGPEFDAHRLEIRTLQDYVTLFGARDVAFEPGSKWAYSNYGFLLLGLIVEKAAAVSYYDYVRDHVYAPAGMTRTGSQPEDEPVPDRAVGYMRVGGAWQPNVDTLPYRGTSAGGGYSTAGDFVRFADAIVGHKLLNATYTDLLTTGTVDAPGGQKYAYGFGDFRNDGVRFFGHNGGAPGMNGDLRIYPDSGYTVVALANLDPPAAGRIVEFIGSRLPRP
jgi:D-alanyl-D-alanine carboxypeptidase